jgi:hypothetical protein
MSAFSAQTVNPNLDSSNLEQLKAEAIALEGSKKHEEALAKYEEVLVIQQRDLPVGHLDTHETLTSIDRPLTSSNTPVLTTLMLKSPVSHCLYKVKVTTRIASTSKLIRGSW